MKENKITEPIYTGDILQNQFTAYVELALRNRRISYYRHIIARQSHEISIGSEKDFYLHIDWSDAVNAVKPDSWDITPDTLSPSLASAIRNINKIDMIILRLRILYGYPYKKIAVIVNMSSTAVRSRYSRVIQKLRHRLEDSSK